ncbi:MAG: hypothetical protein CMJ64_23135 [Planctomycetaceae bacterium]|jgi:predicted dinucleotide-binding enzyme|nr:hypothetical protein [Planctomycetaceae bacterium]
MPKCVVFGGAGVFGSIVARELHDRAIDVIVAGRNLNRAEEVAADIGCAAVRADLNEHSSCHAAIEGVQVAINCAGPFKSFNDTLLESCVEAGCHYVDITDDREYASRVRERRDAFAAAGLTAIYGCSSLPGISGALAIALRKVLTTDPAHARITLFIGNDNAKGTAAVRSAARLLGRTIRAPQGELRGFRDPETVDLPPPFGRRIVLNFDSPDYDLLPEQIGASSLVVKVGLELRIATALFGSFATYAPHLGTYLLPKLISLNHFTRRVGCSGGAIAVELFDKDGNKQSASAVVAEHGQHMAALPAVYAALRLCQGEPVSGGATTAYELLGAEELLGLLEADGVSVLRP